MGFILQVILSIVAWNRGWRWLALIPMGAALFLGFMIGIIGAGMGYSPEEMSWAIVLDIIVFIILIYMCAKPPQPNQLDQTNTEKLPEENK
jgi:hypothetical protein